MKLFQRLKDSQCRCWLRRRGIKFSPSLRDIKKGAELVLEEGVVLRNVQMGFRSLKIGAMTYMRGDGELWNVSQIGRFCSIGNGAVIGHDRAGHPLDWVSTHPFSHSGTHLSYSSRFEPTKIGHDVWIGRDAMILEGVEVGTGAVIATRSVVTRDVPPYAIVAGSPAKIIRYRHPEEIIQKLLDSQWWCLPVEKLLGLPIEQPSSFLEQVSAIEPEGEAYASVRLTSSCWQVSDSVP